MCTLYIRIATIYPKYFYSYAMLGRKHFFFIEIFYPLCISYINFFILFLPFGVCSCMVAVVIVISLSGSNMNFSNQISSYHPPHTIIISQKLFCMHIFYGYSMCCRCKYICVEWIVHLCGVWGGKDWQAKLLTK